MSQANESRPGQSGTEISPEILAQAAQAIAARLVRGRPASEQLGEIFLACERAARDSTREYRSAVERGALEEFLLPRVRESLSRESGPHFTGGWLGTYIGADGRPLDGDGTPESDTTDREALEISAQALARAESQARAAKNQTMLRNLQWYRERLAHKSYDAIASAEERVPAKS